MSIDCEQWFIRIRGQVQGPYSLEQLRTLIRRGAFGRTHEVSQDRNRWQRASVLTELFAPPPMPSSSVGQSQPEVPDARRDEGAPALDLDARAVLKWYVIKNKEPQGPLSEFDLSDWIAQGALQPDDPIWMEGMANWAQAASVGLFTFPRLSPPIGESNFGLAATSNVVYDVTQPNNSRMSPPPNSSVGVISLILGILGWTLLPVFGAIGAVILGHVAAGEAKRSATQVPGTAVAGLLLGYSALVITAVGVFILLAIGFVPS